MNKNKNKTLFSLDFKSNSDLRLVKDPFLGSLLSHLYYYPVPSNLNYFWGFGSLLGGLLVIQILTGILLAVHYTADVSQAFYSVEFIMSNVKGGWFISYMHSSGASLLFMTMYSHILSSMYYSTFSNVATWITGLVLFLLMMATGFLGYILIWGQMSLWGATVITNLFGTIPIIGNDLVILLWGGFSVDGPTLKSFFMLHFLMPFMMLVVLVLHILYLHKRGSSNPLGVDSMDMVTFYPKFVMKDIFGFIVFYGFALIFLIFYYPNLLGHPDNYMMANAIVTPKHITPEWYFEPFYAILSSMPNKLGGVIVMGLAILVLAYLPLLDFNITTTKFSTISQFFFWFFVGNFMCLGWLGMCPMEDPFILCSSIATFFYFSYFLMMLPFIAYMESLL